MSDIDPVVKDFVKQIRDEYSDIEKVDIETPEYGHSIRVTTSYETENENLKQKLLDLKSELEEDLSEHLEGQNFTKDRQVFIRMDW